MMVEGGLTQLLLVAVTELHATALLLVVLGFLAAIAVVLSRLADRLGVPVVLLFLVLGMLGGTEGIGGIAFEDYQLAVRLSTAALVLILFDGGLNTSLRAVRQVIYPAAMLATVGVAATAALVALFARLIGMPWPQALLLGAVVSSTDAAAVFAILRGGRLQLKQRLGRTLEVESCVNDPMAVIMTVAIIQVISAGEPLGLWILLDVPLQLAIGGIIGVLLGILGRILLQRLRLTTLGLYPALTLSLALLSFGAATMVGGSGFLSVYATAVILGASVLPYRSGLTRIHDALAWLSQIGMFLMLGLLVFPSRLLEVAGAGVAVGLFLAFVARPLAVLPCLLPFKYPMKEAAFIGWMGLRGAVPIILATFPLLVQVPNAEHIFNLVFFIVVVSALIPGTTIRAVTRQLALDTPQKPSPPAVLEINSAEPLQGQLASFFIEPTVAACGAVLSEIEFPPAAAVVMLVRGRELLAARGGTRLEPGDHVYVFFRPEDRPWIELLLGRPERGGAEQE